MGKRGRLDEFDRILLEVLSVVAQQLLVIRQALVEQTQFIFEGSQIALKSTLGVSITMNPGYAGRTELPDNLKAQFRPIAMMVPDLALIAEVMLAAEGFRESKPLAKKTTTLYALMVQQLLSLIHI